MILNPHPLQQSKVCLNMQTKTWIYGHNFYGCQGKILILTNAISIMYTQNLIILNNALCMTQNRKYLGI
jgi:hypothetical protein